MKVSLPLFVLMLFLKQNCFSQIEILPANSTSPSNIRQSANQDFIIGLGNASFLHFDRQFRLGLGNDYVSNGNMQFANYAKFHIRHNSTGAESENSGGPHLLLDEAEFGDFARLRFSNSILLSGSVTKTYTRHERYWDIAGKVDGTETSNDKLHIFNSSTGNILTVQGDEKVGINNSSPSRTLDINGNNRISGYTETGNESIPYKTRLIAFQSLPIPCSNNTSFDFDLGINENRIIAADVLVQTGSSSFYPPNERFGSRDYSYRINGTRIYFEFGAVAGCDFATRGFRIWLTYSESAIAMPIGPP